MGAGEEDMPFNPASVGLGPSTLKEPALAITIGLLRLTDAAPVIVAKEMGFFADQNIDVRLSIEPSWANIADKLTYGKLDAAVMLPPLAFAVSLGLRGIGTPLIVPVSLSLNGNSITLSNDLASTLEDGDASAHNPLEMGRRLKTHLSPGKRKVRFAVVHAFSTHNLLLRYWLGAVGIDPDKEIDLSIVPPADMVQALRDGHIDGFCAGAPWGEVAARTGTGGTVATSSQIWRNHPEKCLAVRSDWAERHPQGLQAMLRALLRAAQFCDDPKNAPLIAATLAHRDYLAVDAHMIRASLPTETVDKETTKHNVDMSIFFANAANFPWRSHAAWFLTQMMRWGYLARNIDIAELSAQVYRPDLFRAAALAEKLPAPRQDFKLEGAHAAPWSIAGDIADIAMQPDIFCDGCVFDSAALLTNDTTWQSQEA